MTIKQAARKAEATLDDFDGELRHLVETTDLSPRQARELIGAYGSDREKLMAAARTMKAEG